MEEYYEDDFDIEIDEIREDFEFIWKKNIIQVELIRRKNPQAGDYFREDEDEEEIRRKIWLNVQGVSTEAYRQMEAGIITPDVTYNCFARWDEDIENTDLIKLGDYLYRIDNFNKSYYAGQVAFQEFQLKRIDKE